MRKPKGKSFSNDVFAKWPMTDPLLGPLAADVQERCVINTTRACGFTIATGETVIQMLLGFSRRLLAFGDLLDQIDAAPRAFKFITRDLIRWTGGRTKAAMHTFLKNVLCTFTLDLTLEQRT
jgi:hypothetical protein